jgi:tripartite-type tricarboxylate transporter receptor subunit TctC
MFALAFRQPRKMVTAALVAAVALSCAAQGAAAQAYPTRPVTVIVPFAAGGGNDILARLLTQHMGRALGQQFVIENRAPSPRRRRTATR